MGIITSIWVVKKIDQDWLSPHSAVFQPHTSAAALHRESLLWKQKAERTEPTAKRISYTWGRIPLFHQGDKTK